MPPLPFFAKICGVTSSADAEVVARFGAQHGGIALGLNFHRGSSRYVSVERAANIIQTVRDIQGSRVTIVGVFVEHDHSAIESISRQLSLDWIQLHGDYSPATHAPHDLPTIVAVPFEGPDSANRRIEQWREWGARAVLLDAARAAGFGGTGRVIDWPAAALVARELPIILAGGLTPENLSDAIGVVAPMAVDVASGVESAPGRKDPDKVLRFLEIANTLIGPKPEG